MNNPKVISCLETLETATGKRTVICTLDRHIEAPNWTYDGAALIYNADGLIWRYDLASGEHTQIDTGDVNLCNNDHVLSFDGRYIAISGMPRSELDRGYASNIYILPIGGGTPRRVTEKSPSYLHGWSPDGRTLAYCAMRDELGGDIFTIPADGGEEKRLTAVEGLCDGPEYSPDGRHIWFNSVRSGLMQIWRMDADGANPTRITQDDRNNWFAHVSPDGEKVVYISYSKDDVAPGDHPANKNVKLHLMNYDGSDCRVIAELFGGQGTLNVNSWSPDSTHIAFVSYKLVD